MKIASIVCRVIMGLLFVVFGLNGFFHFIPMDQPMPELAQKVMGTFAETKYLLPLIKGTEIVAGLLFLIGLVPLALIVIAPVLVNIIAFHIFVAPGFSFMHVVLVACYAFLVFAYREFACPLFCCPSKCCSTGSSCDSSGKSETSCCEESCACGPNCQCGEDGCSPDCKCGPNCQCSKKSKNSDKKEEGCCGSCE